MSQSRNLSGCQVFDPTHLPTDWTCVPLKERLELLYGRPLKEELRKRGDVYVFGSNGVVGTHNVRWLDAPGVLVGRKGTVGAVHYTQNPFWPIDTVYYVRPVCNDQLQFLYYLLDYGYYTSTLSFAQDRVGRCVVHLIFAGTAPSWMRVYETTPQGSAKLLKTLPPVLQEPDLCEYVDVAEGRQGRSARVYMFWRDAP
jgi:hypothetical protein